MCTDWLKYEGDRIYITEQKPQPTLAILSGLYSFFLPFYTTANQQTRLNRPLV